MADPDTSWIVSIDDENLYSEAIGHGADKFVLSARNRIEMFLSVKRNSSGILNLYVCQCHILFQL
jgi:hypothetical protein